jgi:hypothetical protein
MTSLSSRLRRLAALGACAGAVVCAGLLTAPSALADTTDSYTCTGSTQTSTVPAGDNFAIVAVNGAAGGNATNNGQTTSGGLGEQLVAEVPVTPGSQLDVIAGCQGASDNGDSVVPGGYGGGGAGGEGDSGEDGSLTGGGGGGASYVMPHGGAFTSLFAIAGGGGGAGNTGGYENLPSDGAGGVGGNAENNGGSGGEDTNTMEPGGQGGASGNTGGAGGLAGNPANIGNAGQDGSAGQGGHGGSYDSYDAGAGGGGGGGLIGGGGGGYGYPGNQDGPGGGGGGGGQGGVQNGAALVSSTVAAMSGDGSVSITYTVAADISVNPTSQDFGARSYPGSETVPFRFTNTGEQPLNIGQAVLTGANADQFSIVTASDECSNQTVAAGNSCLILVRFAPDASASGAETASLSVPSNAASGTMTVALTGTAQTPAGISVTPSSEDFGTVTDGQSATQTFTVTDTGQHSLDIGQLSENGSEFTLVAGQDGCSGQTVTSGQACTFQATFAPTGPAAETGTVEVPSNAYPDSSVAVQLSGTGQLTLPQALLSENSESYGTVAVGQTAAKTVTVTNSGQMPLVLGQATVAGTDAGAFSIVAAQDSCSGQTVAAGGTCTIGVAFSPTSAGAQSASLSVPSNDPASPATVALSGTGQTATQPTTPTAPKLVEQLNSIGTPTAGTLYSHGEKVRVHCNKACSVNVTLMVYHRAIARGKQYRGLLHADRATEPWTRVGIAQTVVTLPGAGFRTVLIKLKPGSKTVLSYAGSILLGVYTTPAGGRGPVSKRWVTISGPDMNAKVSAHQHSR